MLFRVTSTTFATVEVEALRDCTAQELVNVLLGSKAMGRRVLAERRIVRANDGRVLAGASRIAAGEGVVLTLATPECERDESTPHDQPVRVLWQDRFALAVDKPLGLLVHGDGTGAPTLTDHVREALRRMARDQGWPFSPVPQAVNRLDVETSGIVLFSLTKEFQPAFDALVGDHGGSLKKYYLGIVEGTFPRGPITIDAPMARDRHQAQRMRVGPSGKPSQTIVAGLEQRQGCSLVACRLLTGRRHQIRVHLSHAGHPLLGDPLYGTTGGPLMLHAHALSFVHPVTGERVMLCTEWPGRFAKLFSCRGVDWPILD